jgi:hypothetical protein
VTAVEAASRGGPIPPTAGKGSGPPPSDTEFTLEDIRDLLRYKRESAVLEQRRRVTLKPVMSPTEALNHTYWSALNSSQPGRLTEERAASLGVYRRLVRAARAEYHTELDEATLGLLVADVAEKAGAPVETAMRMPLDEFDRLWAQGSLDGQSRKRRKRTGGRPSDTDHVRDRRIYEAWNSGRHATFVDLARELDLPNAKAAERAIDRHRKRLGRAREGGEG